MGTIFNGRAGFGLYLRIDATSMMSGISRENPALDFVLWIA
jgi:hypothetical protein